MPFPSLARRDDFERSSASYAALYRPYFLHQIIGMFIYWADEGELGKIEGLIAKRRKSSQPAKRAKGRPRNDTSWKWIRDGMRDAYARHIKGWTFEKITLERSKLNDSIQTRTIERAHDRLAVIVRSALEGIGVLNGDLHYPGVPQWARRNFPPPENCAVEDYDKLIHALYVRGDELRRKPLDQLLPCCIVGKTEGSTRYSYLSPPNQGSFPFSPPAAQFNPAPFVLRGGQHT